MKALEQGLPYTVSMSERAARCGMAMDTDITLTPSDGESTVVTLGLKVLARRASRNETYRVNTMQTQTCLGSDLHHCNEIL